MWAIVGVEVVSRYDVSSCIRNISCILSMVSDIDCIIICNICNKDVLSNILRRKYKEIRMCMLVHIRFFNSPLL